MRPFRFAALAWDGMCSALRQHVGSNCDKLKQAYSTQVVLRQAPRMGLRAVQRVRTDGSIEVTLEG